MERVKRGRMEEDQWLFFSEDNSVWNARQCLVWKFIQLLLLLHRYINSLLDSATGGLYCVDGFDTDRATRCWPFPSIQLSLSFLLPRRPSHWRRGTAVCAQSGLMSNSHQSIIHSSLSLLYRLSCTSWFTSPLDSIIPLSRNVWPGISFPPFSLCVVPVYAEGSATIDHTGLLNTNLSFIYCTGFCCRNK